jgi:hypothetical protein
MAIKVGSLYVQANGSLGASPVYQTAATWGTKTVTGLTASTAHSFTVVAQNGAGTATAFSSATVGNTLEPGTAYGYTFCGYSFNRGKFKYRYVYYYPCQCYI